MGAQFARRIEVADATLERLGSITASFGIMRSAELLADYAWSGRTAAILNFQLQPWVQFCTFENHPLLPTTKVYFIAFVG